MQEGTGPRVVTAFVEMIFDNSDNRIPVRILLLYIHIRYVSALLWVLLGCKRCQVTSCDLYGIFLQVEEFKISQVLPFLHLMTQLCEGQLPGRPRGYPYYNLVDGEDAALDFSPYTNDFR